MTIERFADKVGFIWSVADMLRGPYKPAQYGAVMLPPRTCAVCGREFPGWGRQRFCGKPCQRKWDYRQHADQRRANRREYYRRQKEGQHGGREEGS